MGFSSGMGRGLRGMVDGAAGTQALLAGDYGAYGRLRGRQARRGTAQAAMEEERRQALIMDLLSRGLDPAQAELALANPDFARQFGASRFSDFQNGRPYLPASTDTSVGQADVRGPVVDAFQPSSPSDLHGGDSGFEAHRQAFGDGTSPGLVGANVYAATQDGFDRNSEIAVAQRRARETGRDYRDILREMRGLPPRPQSTDPAAAPAPRIRKPPTPPPAARPGSRVSNPAPWRPGGQMSRQNVDQHAANAMRMYKIHIDRGMSPEQAAGWAANAQAESHGKFTMSQYPQGPGRGLFQWGHPNLQMDRRRVFQQQFGYPIEKSTEEDQLAFRDWELANTLQGAARRISRARTAGDVAEAITRYYEIPQDPDRDSADRANIAEAILRLAQQP